MGLKVYLTLEEALEDIRFKEDLYKKIEIGFNEEERYSQKQFFEMTRWLRETLTGLKQPDSNWHIITLIMHDLASNAYRHGVQDNQSGIFALEAYIGQKGVLCGTKQNANFFTYAQIELLKQSKPVSSTNIDDFGNGITPNIGTKRFVNQGNGLLIVPLEKRLYIAKYYLNK